MDIDIFINYRCVHFLLHFCQNWNFAFSSSDFHWGNHFLSLQVNLTNKKSNNKESFLYRVPLIINQSASFNFGFASNLILMLWCVCGGFLLFFLECNYLTILMKPNYEKPIDTAEDILDRGLTIIPNPGTGSIVEALKSSPFEITRKLAERTTVPKVIVLHMKNFHFKFYFLKGLEWVCWVYQR